MSTDWGIGCRTCRDAGLDPSVYFTGEWNNCREIDTLRKLADNPLAIIEAHERFGGLVRFFWNDWASHDYECNGLAEFAIAHRGHVLAPMNEYHAFEKECGRYIQCGECKGHTKKCRLDWNHEGPCS